MSKESSTKYYKDKLQKKACERYQSLYKDEKEKSNKWV